MSGSLVGVVARRINAAPVAGDFSIQEVIRPQPEAGEALIAVTDISADPYIGGVLRGQHMGETQPAIGDVVPGRGIGVVLQSQDPSLSKGDIVRGVTGWRTHVCLPAGQLEKLSPRCKPLSLYLGALGMPGLTAWAGINQLARVGNGDTVLISSAAGAVGGTAGQLARAAGASRVIGIAGGSEKCRMVTQTYGFDACIDYKQADWAAQVPELCPDGVNVYFDNVGGPVLEVALINLALYGRVILCGLASQYHAPERPAGPNPGIFIGKRAEVRGLVVYDFADKQATFTSMAEELIQAGTLHTLEDKVTGLTHAPALFDKLMRGANLGKSIVHIGTPEEVS